jgi:protocadherin-16/23
VVGSVSGSDHLYADNLITSHGGVHVTYTLTPLTSDSIEGAFDMDRNTGSLVVARRLDREVQNEYRLEIRALDTSASNNPQSSAVTVKVEIADINDNAPVWPMDPISINVSEDVAPGSVVHNFTAADADSGSNGEIQYRLVKNVQSESNHFAVDPLTGALTLLEPLDFENITEYILIVEATDQSSNATERLSTSVTARVRVTDANDNQPIFISPQSSNKDDTPIIVYLSDSATVGQLVTHVLAIDKDSGDNGRVSYSIISGNEDERFGINFDNGFIELAKPLIYLNGKGDSGAGSNSVSDLISGKYNLFIRAKDHGTPMTKEAKLNLQIVIQGSTNNPPRFIENLYYVNISENIPSGSFVIRVGAKSFNNENGEYPMSLYPHKRLPIFGGISSSAIFENEKKNYVIKLCIKSITFDEADAKQSPQPCFFSVSCMHGFTLL